MASTNPYVAIDIGAESGRVIAGNIGPDGVTLDILHRFVTGGIHMLGSLCWDFPFYLREIEEGLRLYSAKYGQRPLSIGADSWANTFGLIDKHGRLLATPLHYRDACTDGIPEKFYQLMSAEKLYARTGIQMMQHNLLYQITSMAMAGDPLLQVADRMLMGAELITHFLCGECPGEYTNVSTTQLYDVPGDCWALDVSRIAGVPEYILPPVVKAGTKVGTLLRGVAERCRLSPDVELILPACHDTGSAVAGVPAEEGDDWLYISSGTWSLVGAEVGQAIVTPESCRANFTNEGGACGTIRFLKNVVGLWLIQECRREWAMAGETVGYDELTAMARDVNPFRCLIDVTDERFLDPGPMTPRITAYCRETGQKPPETKGGFTRTALEGLALAYRKVCRVTSELTGRKYRTLHVVGGGSQNALLNQMTADATGLVVKAGPVEATAIGNVMMQAMGMGRLASLAEGRAYLRKNIRTELYCPAANAEKVWNEAEGRLDDLRK